MNSLAQIAISDYNMILPGDRVLAAVSGGADSVALLHYLKSIQLERNFTLAAAHINHNLRGSESFRDENFVRELCSDNNIPLHVLNADIESEASKTGESIEECARRIRYSYFDSLGFDKIATAHTKSDNAETVLLNLVRGTGIKGLCGIPPVRGNIIRPLIYASREDILAYLTSNTLKFVTDSTNSDTKYRRNFIRAKVIPSLTELNPSFGDTISKMSKRIKSDSDYLDSIAEDLFEASKYGAKYKVPSPLPHHAILTRFIICICKAQKISYENTHLESAIYTLKNKSACIFPGGHAFECIGDLCGFNKPVFYEDFLFELKTGTTKIPLGFVNIVKKGKDFEYSTKKVNKLLFKNTIDCDMIRNNPVIRSRNSGDRINLPGRNVSKSLKKLFNEAKIPQHLRNQIVVIADDDGVLWVEGFGPDNRAAISDKTTDILSISLERVGG